MCSDGVGLIACLPSHTVGDLAAAALAEQVAAMWELLDSAVSWAGVGLLVLVVGMGVGTGRALVGGR